MSAPAATAQAPAFRCPTCGRLVTTAMRLPYPAGAIGMYAPVYRCACCGRHVGEPVRPPLAPGALAAR